MTAIHDTIAQIEARILDMDGYHIKVYDHEAQSIIAYVRALEKVRDAAAEVTKDVDRLERFESIGSVRLEAMEYLARTIEALAAAREAGK